MFDEYDHSESFNETFPEREPRTPDLTECPTHGETEVLSYGRTGGSDPYAIERAACGCNLVCYGPGEPMTIIGRRSTPLASYPEVQR